MNINYKQPQFELFPGNSTIGDDATRPRFFLANLTLTIENLVVLSILGIMVAVFAYSLGVERGKHVMAAQWNARAQAKPMAAEVPAIAAQAVTAIKIAGPSVGSAVANAPVQAIQPTPTVIVQQNLQKADPRFKFTVQLASYADGNFARKVAQDLDKKGFETIVMQKGKYAILCVGKFNQKNEAMAMISKLKSKYKDCLVRSM